MAFLDYEGLARFKGKIKSLQTSITSPTADGSASAFIDTLSQDEQGVITATKKNVYGSDISISSSNSQKIGPAIENIQNWKPSGNGTAGQVLRSNGNGTTHWDDEAPHEEIAEEVANWLEENVPKDTTVVVDRSLSFENAAAEAKTTGQEIGLLKTNKLSYPTDSEDDIIFPASEKMLTIKPNGSTDYEDIPTGNVIKDLLFNSFSDDESKTTVSITINTSGTPATGEVRGLRSTIDILRGDGTVGIVRRHDGGYLWYVGNGKSLIMPVTAGHTYKFVQKDRIAEDTYNFPSDFVFSSGFDFSFTTPYVQIPNTTGAINFDPSVHSTDGYGRVFNGAGIIIPEGMNYMAFSVVGIMRQEGQPDNIREFEVYDYTEYPVDATYDKIVEDPVVGDTYKVAYALTRATSSNNATTVGGSSQYKTVITAESGKIISSCSVKVGGQTYTTSTSEITIDGANSNIKIIAVAEALPDDTYIGAYEVKKELIPTDLLDAKLDIPDGLLDAEEGQLLLTDGSGGITIGDANALDAVIHYPIDSEEDIILPPSQKMLIINPDGSSAYADVPTGNVSKALLFDSFNDDETKTRVSITINTSGTQATGEVQNLRGTAVTLRGDGTVGLVRRHDGGYLWYVGNGRSLIMPVTPGHTYKFVAKTPNQEDGWYGLQDVSFAPGFDFNFTTPYVQIPNTDNSISFDAEVHSTDGAGKVFNGAGITIPNGMNYLVWSATGIMRQEGQTDNIREFKVYDYTLYPTNATYDKIVDDPVVGDTYRITYNLTDAVSSNNATFVAEASQYITNITAASEKIFTSCSVVIGSQIYTPVDGVLTINDADSNITITAVAESLPDDTYVGAYTVKRELIPSDLLAEKLDAPSGLQNAEEGQMLYTNGSGGLIIRDAPFVPNRKVSMEWKDAFSHWSAGYLYDPSNSYAYTQLASTDTIWGQNLQIKVSCTPFDNLIPVEQGEKYRYLNPPVWLDRINGYVPSVIIFDANKNVIQTIESQGGTHFTEINIPKNGAYMAILYYNDQTFQFQKYDVKTFEKADLLDAIRANYRSYLLGTPPVKKTLDKVYFCIGADDLRRGWTKRIHEALTANNIPYYLASIPEAVKGCISDDPYKTNFDYMQLCVANGGEVVCHSDDWITSSNVDDFDTLYKYFCTNKRHLEFYGFDVHGIFKAGGDGYIHDADKRLDAWAAYYYDYGDAFCYTFPYRFLSRGNLILEWANAGNIDRAIQKAFDENSYACFAMHEFDSNASEMFNRILTDLSGYTRGVDYDFITPYELYGKLMQTPTQD